MEMNIEVEKRDVIALSLAVVGRGKLLSISTLDEDNNSPFDKVVMKVDFRSAEAAFWAGVEFEKQKEPYTDDEMTELIDIYEQENDL